MTGLSARLDYFRSIYHDPSVSRILASGLFAPANVEPHVSLYGYRHCVRNVDCGALHLSNPHDERMGNCVQFGGAALLALETITGIPSWKALVEAGIEPCRVTRCDVAIDVMDSPISAGHVLRALEQGLQRSRFKSWRIIKGGGSENGTTLYVGGRESTRQIRIYDKGAEQGLALNWWRFEMQFTQERAAEVWEAVKPHDDMPDLLPFARALFISLLDFPEWAGFQRLLGSTAHYEWAEIPRGLTDTEAWLMSQVAPTFRKAFDRDGDWRFLDAFISRVKRAETGL